MLPKFHFRLMKILRAGQNSFKMSFFTICGGSSHLSTYIQFFKNGFLILETFSTTSFEKFYIQKNWYLRRRKTKKTKTIKIDPILQINNKSKKIPFSSFARSETGWSSLWQTCRTYEDGISCKTKSKQFCS